MLIGLTAMRFAPSVNTLFTTTTRTTVHDQMDSIKQIEQAMPTLDGDATPYFAENGFGKPVQTLQHPAGEYYNEVTYVAYQGPHEDPYVCAYNHKTKTWTGPIQAGVSALGDDPPVTDPDKIDNHGRPTLFVDGQGYIHVVFGGHGGHRGLGRNPLGFNGSGQQTHVVSKKPGDISAWELLDNISPFGTYSQLVKMSNGNIYLFYRHGSHRSDWVYQKSIDNGRTFARPVSILKHQPQTAHPTVYDAWYAWFKEGPDDTVICAFNYHPCATKSGHSSERLNAYVMKMITADDSWENIKGEKLNTPLSKAVADTMTMIVETNGKKTRLGTILADTAGKTHLYFKGGSKDPSFFYHSWTGSDWHTTRMTDSKISDADFFIGKDQKIKLLVTEQLGDMGEIAWWTPKDDGINWDKGAPLLSVKKANLEMSALIRNAHPDAQVIVAEIPNDPISLYSKLYLLGDAGPVSRKQPQKD